MKGSFLDIVREINAYRHFDAGKATEASIARCLVENKQRQKGEPIPVSIADLRKMGVILPIGETFMLADDDTVYKVVP